MTGWFSKLRSALMGAVAGPRQIPDALWASTLSVYPFLAARPQADVMRLRELSASFLGQKEFHGAHDLEVTDSMAVAIAAQACLPVLHLPGGLSWYDDFVGIVVQAGEVVARREVTDEAGVVHHYDEVLSGEAMELGPVMLSWQDVADAGTSAAQGYNVVVHEFAHKIDMVDGTVDGTPPLPNREARATWARVCSEAFLELQARVESGKRHFIDEYGATNEAEFFAVATEAFWRQPKKLERNEPELYGLLRGFYQFDPV